MATSKKSAQAPKADKAEDIINNVPAEEVPIEVVDTVELADLTLYTIGTEMQLGETREGSLMKRGKYDYKFLEKALRETVPRPWEKHQLLAKKGNAKLTLNCNGVFLFGYWKEDEFADTSELVEAIVDDTEGVCQKVQDIDLKKMFRRLLKQKLRKLSQ